MLSIYRHTHTLTSVNAIGRIKANRIETALLLTHSFTHSLTHLLTYSLSDLRRIARSYVAVSLIFLYDPPT